MRVTVMAGVGELPLLHKYVIRPQGKCLVRILTIRYSNHSTVTCDVMVFYASVHVYCCVCVLN